MINFLKKSAAKKSKSKKDSVPVSIPKKSEKTSLLKKDISLFSSFSRTERINFFRNLSAMVSSGVSIVEALEILIEQVKSKRVKNAIQSIANDTRNGMKLSKAMAKFPRYFSESLVETIEMGDVSGKLTEILDRIATDFEKDEELKRKIMGAIMYPVVITIMMIVVLIVFAFYILPSIAELFTEINAPLPLPTKIILTGSSLVKNHPLMLIGIILGIILFFYILLKIKKGRYVIHYLLLKIPIFGELIKEYNLILFFRSLQSLFSSGISLTQSVQIAKKTTTNDVYKKTLDDIQPVLLHGVPLSNAILPFPFLFPRQTQKIIWVGEKTGKVEESLNQLTNFYERSVDYRTRMLTVLIEPILMIVIGIVVGGLALSIFMPIYGLVGAL